MSNFLTHLILTSRGEVPTVHPRLQALFEPPRPTPLGLVAAEVAAAPEMRNGERTTLEQAQPTLAETTPAPHYTRQAESAGPTIDRSTQDFGGELSGAQSLALRAGEIESPLARQAGDPRAVAATMPLSVNRTHEAELALHATPVAAITVETSATQPAHRPTATAQPILSSQLEYSQTAAVLETPVTTEQGSAEVTPMLASGLVSTSVHVYSENKPPTLTRQAGDPRTIAATLPHPVSRRQEAELVLPSDPIAAIPAETLATQSTHRLTANAQPTLLLQREHVQPATMRETTETTERGSAEATPVPMPELNPTPAYVRSTSKPPTLNQGEEPFFNSNQPVLIDQPRPLLPADQGAPTTLGKLLTPSQAAPIIQLLDQAEESEFAEVQVMPLMKKRGVSSPIMDAATRSQLHREPLASDLHDAHMTAPVIANQAIDSAPVIRVTIGRIEVRALQPTPSPTVRPATRQPDNRLSLEAYLKQSRRTP